jgi:hypothetical protein
MERAKVLLKSEKTSQGFANVDTPGLTDDGDFDEIEEEEPYEEDLEDIAAPLGGAMTRYTDEGADIEEEDEVRYETAVKLFMEVTLTNALNTHTDFTNSPSHCLLCEEDDTATEKQKVILSRRCIITS